MYNMHEISIFGFKINLEIIILIGIIYLILVVNTLSSCSNMSAIIEGMGNMAVAAGNEAKNKAASGSMAHAAVSAGVVGAKEGVKIISKEGFIGANTNYGNSSGYTLGDHSKVNTSSWGMPNLVVRANKPLSKAVKEIINRPNGPLPLPEGEMFLFDSIPFKPECCPSTYSSSMGCACMNTDTYNYLVTRAGNNVPYSDY